MTKIPILSGKQLVKTLQKAGFDVVRRKGSHVSLRKQSYKTVVPLHKELAIGTLLAILKQCGLSKDELISLLEK